jgi:hypothetical protein
MSIDNKAVNKMFVGVTEDVNKLLTFQTFIALRSACFK